MQHFQIKFPACCVCIFAIWLPVAVSLSRPLVDLLMWISSARSLLIFPQWFMRWRQPFGLRLAFVPHTSDSLWRETVVFGELARAPDPADNLNKISLRGGLLWCNVMMFDSELIPESWRELKRSHWSFREQIIFTLEQNIWHLWLLVHILSIGKWSLQRTSGQYGSREMPCQRLNT